MSEANLLLQSLCQLWPWYCGECEKPGPGPRQGKHTALDRVTSVFLFSKHRLYADLRLYM